MGSAAPEKLAPLGQRRSSSRKGWATRPTGCAPSGPCASINSTMAISAPHSTSLGASPLWRSKPATRLLLIAEVMQRRGEETIGHQQEARHRIDCALARLTALA